MKQSRKQRRGCRFTLVFVLLLLAAAWTVSVSSADEPAGQKSGQIVVEPLPAGPAAHWVAGARQIPAVAAKPLKPVAPAVREQATLAAKALPSQAQETPEQLSAIVKKTSAFLIAPRFTFLPDKALDPFVPFVSLQKDTGGGAPGSGPLTPLQKMTLAEMERGLKAIVWGDLGKMAVIEDATGKGYIVGVGTPAGPNGGVITQVQDTCLVIEQQVWNSQTKKRVSENFTVKMVKKDEGAL